MRSATLVRRRVGGRFNSTCLLAARLFLLVALLVLASGSLCRRQPQPSFQIENISNNPSYSDRPCIACTKDGHVALAWSDYATGYEEIWLVEKNEGGGWSSPYNLSKAGSINGSRSVSLCYDRNGTLHAAWSQFAESGQSGAWTIAYTRRPAGGDWAVPETVRYGTAVQPHIAVDTLGTVYIEFEDFNGSKSTVCCTSRGPSGSWATVHEVSTRSSVWHGSGYLAATEDGISVAVWRDWSSSSSVVLWSERDTSGSWFTPQAVYASESYCGNPVLSSSHTTFVLAFVEASPRLDMLTKQTHGQWTAPDTTCASNNPGELALGLDADGGVVLAWANHAEGELRLARRNGGWAQIVVSDSLFPNMTSVAVDADSRVHLAWSSQPDYPEPGDIYYTEIEVGDFQK